MPILNLNEGVPRTFHSARNLNARVPRTCFENILPGSCTKNIYDRALGLLELAKDLFEFDLVKVDGIYYSIVHLVIAHPVSVNFTIAKLINVCIFNAFIYREDINRPDEM